MTICPHYFAQIRERAAKRWDQLEADPELAAPWHQLFKQVQSPRHVLSELLQNADDAGATEATASIEEHCFVFTHNGEDFTEEHFSSLCKFGYSNKRALHTIGFRGIGFKSTFSLGDIVQLRTPSLSIAFDHKRFTEPQWVPEPFSNTHDTEIRVAIVDHYREDEVGKNLQEWLRSPISFLFFKHLRRLRIGNQEIYWDSLGAGPAPHTEWMARHDNPDEIFLVAHSEPEAFPEEALAEILGERLLGIDQQMDFPPCRVEIVLGAKGRLHVVLPTGVETPLPFACNAPFIQDPARMKIKDPEISPTNRWLLERVGSLAAHTMLRWLEDASASLAERSRAYGLLPNVNHNDNSLEAVCSSIVETAFNSAISTQPLLLTDAGELKPNGQSIIVPKALFKIWPAEQVVSLIDNKSRPALSHCISDTDRNKLIQWGVVEEISKGDFLSILQLRRFPKPESWRRLLHLWSYIAPEITGWRMNANRVKLNLVPVQGKNALYSAEEIVRLGEKRLLQSDTDWEFLSAHLLVLNQNWPRFLAEQRRDADKFDGDQLEEDIAAALSVLRALGLEESNDVSKVIEQVATTFFAQESKSMEECVRLTHIAAKLGASIGDAFRFVTCDLHLRSHQGAVLFDPDGSLEELLPENWRTEHLLHPEYSTIFTSCSFEDWRRWISSERSGLYEFVPIEQKKLSVWDKRALELECYRRAYHFPISYPYKTSNFIIEDWDFDESLWQHWKVLSQNDNALWCRLLERILAQTSNFWTIARSARVLQRSTTGSTQVITSEALLPAWILKFRDLPCLPDTRGSYHKPAELLLRTPENESLIDVEFFVHGRLDTETRRPLLTWLGVRNTPTGPQRLLNCLRSLAQTDKPPIHEVEKWYRRLDQMLDTCSTAHFADIRKTFNEEKVIFTEEGNWVSGDRVFLSSSEEDVLGVASIRASVRDLSLWRKIGIAEHPTADLVIQWLKKLSSGDPLSQDDARRVRSFTSRHAARVWNECGHWLNLAREWVPVNSLAYSITMQSLVEWKYLHEWVKQKTADFQNLTAEIMEAPTFRALPRLSSCIEERLSQSVYVHGIPERQTWLNQLAEALSLVELEDELETTRIHNQANTLTETVWYRTSMLEIIPYLNGIPAGTARPSEVLWMRDERKIYVLRIPEAKLARIVPERLGKIFGRSDIMAALNYCFGRSPEDVAEYMKENFHIIPPPTTLHSNTIPRESLTWQQDTLVTEHVIPENTPENQANKKDDGVDAEMLSNGIDVACAKEYRQPKSERPSIIERFAYAQGFEKSGADRFIHADGSWIAKSIGNRFPWEQRTAKGDLVRQYWPREQCLMRESFQIDADVWALLEKFPETCSLILLDQQGRTIELEGTRLLTMRNERKIVLYPASYRLVYDGDLSATEHPSAISLALELLEKPLLP